MTLLWPGRARRAPAGSSDSHRAPGDVRTSSFCTAGGCVGFARDQEGGVWLINTKSSDAPLQFTRQEWSEFVLGVKHGEFDVD